MRIGLFSTDFPFREPFGSSGDAPADHQWGGVAEAVYQLALGLGSRGHTVKVFTTSPTKEDIVQGDGTAVTVYRYKKDAQVASTMLSPTFLWKPLKHDLDMVHGHLGTPPGAFAALTYSRARSRPLMTTVHTSFNKVSLKGGSPIRRLALLMFMHGVCSPLLTATDTITSVSEAVMRESPPYLRHVPRTMVVPNGVDLGCYGSGLTKEECRRRLDIEPGRKVILYVGSMSDYKDPGTLLDAFPAVYRRGGDPLLAMIGEGPLRNGLIEVAEKEGLGGSVRLPGFVSEDEKLLYYRSADVFAIPSLGDTFGLVVLEAAAWGLPVVASDLEVFKTLVNDGTDGLIFRRGDSADLADKLSTLLDDGARRAAMGESAVRKAGHYDWKVIVEDYEELYYKTLENKG